MKTVKSGGGLPAIWYVLRKAREAGGYRAMYQALRTPNACKTCALGYGWTARRHGQRSRALPRSVQEVGAGHGGRHAGWSPGDLPVGKQCQSPRHLYPRQLEAAGRITQPLYAGPLDTTYRQIGWDEAIDGVSEKLGDIEADESFFYVSGRSSNEAGFLVQLLARAYGTNNVNNCSYYCHQASG